MNQDQIPDEFEQPVTQADVVYELLTAETGIFRKAVPELYEELLMSSKGEYVNPTFLSKNLSHSVDYDGGKITYLVDLYLSRKEENGIYSYSVAVEARGGAPFNSGFTLNSVRDELIFEPLSKDKVVISDGQSLVEATQMGRISAAAIANIICGLFNNHGLNVDDFVNLREEADREFENYLKSMDRAA